MPDSSSTLHEIKISELPVAPAANATDQLEANQAGVSRSITLAQVAAYTFSSVAPPGGAIPPEWFGAVGDGITDDQPALQRATDSMTAGGTLLLGAKSYRIANTWTISNAPIWIVGQGGTSTAGHGTKIICDTPDTDGIVFSNNDHGGIMRLSVEGPPLPRRLQSGYLLRFRDGGSFIVLRDLVVQRGYRLIGFSSGLGFFCQNVRTRQAGGDIGWHSFPDPTDPSYAAAIQCIDCSFAASDISLRYNMDGVAASYTVSLFVARMNQVRLSLISRVNYSRQRLVQGTSASMAAGQLNITSITWSAGVGTATCSAAHGVAIGSHFTIIGAAPAAFNGRWVSLPTSTSTVLNFTMANVAITSQTWAASDPQNPAVSGVVTAVVRNRVPIGGTFTFTGSTPAACSGTFTALPGTTPTAIKYQLTTNPGTVTVAGSLVLQPTPTTATVPGKLVKIDYWVEQNPDASESVLAHFASPPPTNAWLDATREQPGYFDTTKTSPIYGLREPVLFFFQGQSASNKFVDSSGGFCGDGFVVRADDPSSNAGAYMFANFGLENVGGDGLRVEQGTDFRMTNGYMSAAGNGLNVVYDPLITPNVANASLQPGAAYNGPVRITTTVPHGLPYPVPDPANPGMFIYPTLLLSGVLSSPKIYLVNGRWFVSVVDSLNFDLVAAALYLVSGQPPAAGAPSIWKQNADDPEPVYTSGGSWSNRIPGRGNVRISNSNFRGMGLSSVRLDMPGCIVSNSQLTTAGGHNKDYYGDNVTSLANNGSGLVRVATRYQSEIIDDAVVRLTHVTKAGVTDTTLRDTRYRCTMVDAQTFDLKGSTYNGPYDPPSDTAPVFIMPVGAPLEIGVNGVNSHATGNTMGDWIENDLDPQEYAVINKCANLLTVHDNFVGNTVIAAINNFAPNQRQRWTNNYDYTDYGARTVARYDDGGSFQTSSTLGTGSPEGVVVAALGATYTDMTTGYMWSKRTATGNTGWQQGLTQREEQGVFTPTMTFATPGDLSVAYTTQIGTYTRIGNVVEVMINMTFTPTFTAAASGEIRIAGLPYPAAYSTDGLAMVSSNSNTTWPAGGLDARGITANAQSYLRLQVVRSAGLNSAFVSTNIVTAVNTSWVFNGSYRVT